tara:strand:- start:10 stop:288 length:279 start_codon:yes stop_codon:yes gene_type:complete
MTINLIKGIIIGIISPIILFILVVVFFLEYEITHFINKHINEENFPAIISLSLLSNLSVFFLMIRNNKDIQAKGILLSTFIFGILIIYLKFF